MTKEYEQVTVLCPSCHTPRLIVKHSLKRIKRGERTGKCKTCANRERYGSNGRKKTSQGYIRIGSWLLSQEEQQLFASMNDYGGNIPEHRLVMARKLGRALLPSEIVHHVNRIKDDNRIENLQILAANEHTSVHFDGVLFNELRKQLAIWCI